MREVSFHCPFPAVGKARARSGRNGWYTPAKTVAFESNVGNYAAEALFKADMYFRPAWTGPVELEVECIFATPKSWSKAKTAEKMGRAHCQKPDASNILKSVEDALNGIIYHDDAQVFRATLKKTWGEKAGFRVTVREVPHG